MDKVIVTGLLVVGAVAAPVVVVMTVLSTSGKSSQSVIDSQRVTSERIKTEIKVIAVASNTNGDLVDAWVKNVGVDRILAIDKSDVLLVKTGTGARYDRMIYDTSGATGTWTGDLHESGDSWGRGDTLHVVVTLSDPDLLATGDHVFRFETHNGRGAEKTFSK